jgi:polysaccharide chain length determinant protein (PEP-CTERM system associated)
MFSGRQLTPGDYWLMARRRKWLLLLPLVTIFFGTALLSLSLPDVYRASTLIMVEAQKVPESYVKATVSTPVQERLHTITEQIMSRTWLERVIRELGLLPTLQDVDAVDRYIGEMRRHIEVELEGKGRRGAGSDAFTVSYAGEDPRTVAQVANKLASLFIEENLKVREQHAIGTTEFLAEELQRVRTQLQTQEQAISAFKQRYMGELPEQQDANQRALDRLQLQLQATLEAIEGARNRKSLLVQQLSTLPNDAVLGPEETPVEVQLAQRREALAALQRSYTEQYPDVVRLHREIADLEAQLAADPTASPPPSANQSVRATPGSLRWRLQEDIHQIELQNQQLERQQDSIREAIAAYEQRVANTPKREQELMLLTRDYESTRQNYDSLLEREMQAKVAENLEKRQKAEQFKIIDAARVPRKPWKPNRLMIIIMGLALALAVGGGAVFLVESLDRSFRDPEDLQEYTELPVLATIPLMMTTAEQRRQRLKGLLLSTACVLIPVAMLAGVHVFWMKLDLLLARTLELLQP